MSTYVLMRILESSPQRYELGMRLLTLGQISRTRDRLLGLVKSGQRMLDLGCATGALALEAARKGAEVKGIDISPEMIEIARERAGKAGLTAAVEFAEMGVGELESEETESYDTVAGVLFLSELSDDERHHTLRHVVRILKREGLLLVADEIRPPGWPRRLPLALIRAPLVLLTYLVAQRTTHPLRRLSEEVTRSGLTILSIRNVALGGFCELVAQKDGPKS